jgi:hypothetical protein
MSQSRSYVDQFCSRLYIFCPSLPSQSFLAGDHDAVPTAAANCHSSGGNNMVSRQLSVDFSHRRANKRGIWTATIVHTPVKLIMTNPCRSPSYVPTCITFIDQLLINPHGLFSSTNLHHPFSL